MLAILAAMAAFEGGGGAALEAAEGVAFLAEAEGAGGFLGVLSSSCSMDMARAIFRSSSMSSSCALAFLSSFAGLFPLRLSCRTILKGD